jgi:hypothetical protein
MLFGADQLSWKCSTRFESESQSYAKTLNATHEYVGSPKANLINRVVETMQPYRNQGRLSNTFPMSSPRIPIVQERLRESSMVLDD